MEDAEDAEESEEPSVSFASSVYPLQSPLP